MSGYPADFNPREVDVGLELRFWLRSGTEREMGVIGQRSVLVGDPIL